MKASTIIILLLLVTCLGCRSTRDMSASQVGPESLTLGTAQEFHAKLSDMLTVSRMTNVVCWINGFPPLSTGGAKMVDSTGHASLVPVQWVLVESESPSKGGSCLLTVRLIPKSGTKSPSYLLTWKNCDVEIDPMESKEDLERLTKNGERVRKKTDQLIRLLGEEFSGRASEWITPTE